MSSVIGLFCVGSNAFRLLQATLCVGASGVVVDLINLDHFNVPVGSSFFSVIAFLFNPASFFHSNCYKCLQFSEVKISEEPPSYVMLLVSGFVQQKIRHAAFLQTDIHPRYIINGSAAGISFSISINLYTYLSRGMEMKLIPIAL